MESETLLTFEKQADLAAKREARRKRILENTNNRLEKITGRVHNEEMDFLDTSNTNVIYPDPDIEREVFERSATISPEFDMFTTDQNNVPDIMKILESLRQQSPQFNNSNTTAPLQQQSVQQTKLVKLLKTKIHIAFISIIIYILFVTENQNLTSNSVFLYLLVCEFAEVFLLKSYESKNNFIGIIFLLGGGISLQYLTHIIKIIETVNKILKDVAIFVFFFVGSHIFWQSLFLGKQFNEIVNKEDYFERL